MSKSGFDIFDFSTEDIKDSTSVGSLDQDLYKPSPENGRNGSYSSIVRFIPWWKDSKNSIVKKWTVFLEDPVSGKKRTVDCPSTVNEKSVLRDMFFKLYKSNSVREKELAEKFKRKRACYSLVYIIKDENRPELEGKIMILRFGQKILDKVINEMAPPLGGRPRKPFDPFTGRPFSLIVTKKGGYPNYDDSYFLDEAWPLRINGEEIDRDETKPEDIIKWLETSSPNLEAYYYKKWDDQIVEFVNEAIKNTVPNGRIIEDAISTSKSKSSASSSEKSTSSKTVSSSPVNIEDDIVTSSDNDINFDDDDDDFYKGLEDDE